MSTGDWLRAEVGIIARLRDQVTVPNVRVFSATDLAGVQEQSQHVPAVHVYYLGHRVASQETASGCASLIATQRWVVVTVVRNVRATHEGGHVRAEAGPLLGEVQDALLGFAPAKGCTPLMGADGLMPTIRKGHGYTPLVFTTNLKARGTQ